MNERWVYLDGKICKDKEALIPVADRGFLFGDGMFTTIRVSNANCELLQGHLERLKEQAVALGIRDFSRSFDWLDELIAKNGADKGVWRLKIILTATREQDVAQMGHLLATIEPYNGKAMEPCTLCLFPHPIESPTAHIKSLSYLDHLMVRRHAQKEGTCDAIVTNHKGLVLETGSSNIFWIDQGKFFFPDPELPYLKGVFLTALLRHVHIPFVPTQMTVEEIPSEASVYMCNALTHVRPVISIGNRQLPRSSQYELLLNQIIHNYL